MARAKACAILSSLRKSGWVREKQVRLAGIATGGRRNVGDILGISQASPRAAVETGTDPLCARTCGSSWESGIYHVGGACVHELMV